MSVRLDECHWISLHEASAITGASLAIIQDTIHKHSHSPNTLNTQTIDGDLYVDKNQIINLFPGSANVIEKERIPATLFRWFDELRRAYEASINSMFARVEALKKQHTDEMKSVYDSQVANLQAHIKALEQNNAFYQQQISHQQHTIEQLNQRYDTVMHQLNRVSKQAEAEKDVTPKIVPEPASPPEASFKPTPKVTHKTSNRRQIDAEKLFKKAHEARHKEDFILAADYFEQSAMLGNAKAMGALGRAYFVAEGVEKDLEKALAWLYIAAQNEFEPAQLKLAQLKEKYPQLYLEALAQVELLNIQIEIQQSDY